MGHNYIHKFSTSAVRSRDQHYLAGRGLRLEEGVEGAGGISEGQVVFCFLISVLLYSCIQSGQIHRAMDLRVHKYICT